MTLVPFTKSREPAYRTGFDEFDRIFDNLFKNAMTNMAASAAPAGSVALRMNVSETDKAYYIEAELPGVEEKDVEVTVKDGILSVSGEKHSGSETKDKAFHRIERSYGTFQRSLQLHADADEGVIAAHMKNGILEIEIGKVKEAKKEPRRIDVKKK